MLRDIATKSRVFIGCVMVILVAHLGLRLSVIDLQGFFFEETCSWSYSRSLESLILAMLSDVHPPLYFAVLWAWTGLFGTSEIAFRAPSVLASFLTLITLMVFAYRWNGRRNAVMALLTGVLLMCLPYDIHLAKAARSWTLIVFLCALFTCLYANVSIRDKRNWIIWSAIVGICAVYVHYLALVSLLGAVLASLAVKPTRENLRYAGTTVGILFACLLPWLLLVLPAQLVAKAGIPQHFGFLWDGWLLPLLLSPINPGTWNPFFSLEESAGNFHRIGLGLAMIGITIALSRARRVWADPFARFLTIQVGVMTLLLLICPTPICNQRTMCIFLPPLILLIAFALDDLLRSRRSPEILVSSVFLISFVAMGLSGFPYPSEAARLREITQFLSVPWNASQRPALLLSPGTHALTLQYMESQGSGAFDRVLVAPYPVVLLDCPWWKSLHPELLELPPTSMINWATGPQNEDGLVWTMNRFLTANPDVTDIFYLREGTGDLFGWASRGLVEMRHLDKEARFSLTRMERFGRWAVYHLRSRRIRAAGLGDPIDGMER
jgi:hypothetical protein